MGIGKWNGALHDGSTEPIGEELDDFAYGVSEGGGNVIGGEKA